METAPLTKIAIIDTNLLFQQTNANLINTFSNCNVVVQGKSADDIVDRLGTYVDLVLVYSYCIKSDGYETCKALRHRYEGLPIILVTMMESELAYFRYFQLNIQAILKCDVTINELEHAINVVIERGYYFNSSASKNMLTYFSTQKSVDPRRNKLILKDSEITFLKYIHTEMTYKEIAVEMNLSCRTIDCMRDNLFLKFDLKSRIGLAILAIKSGIATL